MSQLETLPIPTRRFESSNAYQSVAALEQAAQNHVAAAQASILSSLISAEYVSLTAADPPAPSQAQIDTGDKIYGSKLADGAAGYYTALLSWDDAGGAWVPEQAPDGAPVRWYHGNALDVLVEKMAGGGVAWSALARQEATIDQVLARQGLGPHVDLRSAIGAPANAANWAPEVTAAVADVLRSGRVPYFGDARLPVASQVLIDRATFPDLDEVTVAFGPGGGFTMAPGQFRAFEVRGQQGDHVPSVRILGSPRLDKADFGGFKFDRIDSLEIPGTIHATGGGVSALDFRRVVRGRVGAVNYSDYSGVGSAAVNSFGDLEDGVPLCESFHIGAVICVGRPADYFNQFQTYPVGHPQAGQTNPDYQAVNFKRECVDLSGNSNVEIDTVVGVHVGEVVDAGSINGCRFGRVYGRWCNTGLQIKSEQNTSMSDNRVGLVKLDQFSGRGVNIVRYGSNDEDAERNVIEWVDLRTAFTTATGLFLAGEYRQRDTVIGGGYVECPGTGLYVDRVPGLTFREDLEIVTTGTGTVSIEIDRTAGLRGPGRLKCNRRVRLTSNSDTGPTAGDVSIVSDWSDVDWSAPPAHLDGFGTEAVYAGRYGSGRLHVVGISTPGAALFFDAREATIGLRPEIVVEATNCGRQGPDVGRAVVAQATTGLFRGLDLTVKAVDTLAAQVLAEAVRFEQTGGAWADVNLAVETLSTDPVLAYSNLSSSSLARAVVQQRDAGGMTRTFRDALSVAVVEPSATSREGSLAIAREIAGVDTPYLMLDQGAGAEPMIVPVRVDGPVAAPPADGNETLATLGASLRAIYDALGLGLAIGLPDRVDVTLYLSNTTRVDVFTSRNLLFGLVESSNAGPNVVYQTTSASAGYGFLCPQAGTYEITSTVDWDVTQSGVVISTDLRVNGAIVETIQHTRSSDGVQVDAFAPVVLAKGDDVRVQVSHPTGNRQSVLAPGASRLRCEQTA